MTMNGEQSPIKDGWEKTKSFFALVFMAFIYAMGSLVLLGMFLEWILEIDISELRYTYRLIFIAWGGWIIGLHLYYKHQDNEKLQEQLALLRQGETVYSPHPKLNEEWEKEKRLTEFMKKRRQQEIAAARDPFALSDQNKMRLYKEMGFTKDKSNEKHTTKN